MARVLLVDTNFSATPIYDYLEDAGHQVFVIGGNPGDFLARYAKNYFNVDYSDAESLRRIVDEQKIDHVVPGCNDRSYFACAGLNPEGSGGGDTLEATETLNNKLKFRLFAERIGVPAPRVFHGGRDAIRWPAIVKPSDAYSGRGVTVLREADSEKLAEAIARAEEFSRSGCSLIEEYVEGQLYSHSAFIVNGRVVQDFIVEEHCTANPFAVDTSRVVFDFPERMLGYLRDAVEAIARNLRLVDGLFHTQFIRKEDDFWFIEVTRRCPGDLYSQLIELTTGFPYAATYAQPFVGEAGRFDGKPLTESWLMRHTISMAEETLVKSIRFRIPVQVEKMIPLCAAGDTVKASPAGRVALLFARARTQYEFDELYAQTLARNLYALDE